VNHSAGIEKNLRFFLSMKYAKAVRFPDVATRGARTSGNLAKASWGKLGREPFMTSRAGWTRRRVAISEQHDAAIRFATGVTVDATIASRCVLAVARVISLGESRLAGKRDDVDAERFWHSSYFRGYAGEIQIS